MPLRIGSCKKKLLLSTIKTKQRRALTRDNITHVGQRSVVVVVAVARDAVLVVAIVAVGAHMADVASVAHLTFLTPQEPLFCKVRNQDLFSHLVTSILPYGHHSFSHAAPSIWNSLPCEIKT